MLNAPYNGGTHLPDITVVTPVFGENSPDLLFFVAARGHHADIGGIAPGSMSPKATRIEEEGVYIDPFKLVARGRFREDAVLELLTKAPYPARNPAQNIADLKAQVAANEKGAAELAQDGAALRARRRCAPIWAMCRTMRRKPSRASSPSSRIHASRSRPIRGASSRSPSRSTEGAQGDRRFHRHQRASRERVQCAGADHAGLRALRVPHAGRRGHSAECRLPPADQDRRAQGLDAEAALSCAGRCRQCRDEPDNRELSLWRARRARLGARHDEQSHLRQRAAINITRRSARARRPAPASTALPRCRRI